MRNISQSQINLYRNCPYGYYLRYAEKKQPIMYDPSVFEVGRRVHDAIDMYYKNHFRTDTNQEQILYDVYSVLRKDWDTTLPVEYLKKAYVCLENFSRWECNNLQDKLYTKPLTEVKIPANGFYGIVDYVDLKNSKYIDWKTNARAGLGYSYSIQAMMYKILIESKFKIELDEFTFQFLFVDEDRKVDLTTKKMMGVENDIYDFKDKIMESWKTGEFPKEPRTKNGCRGCSFKHYCGGAE